MTREELLSSPGYWEEKIQMDLCTQIQNYMDKEGISRVQLAERLGVTKSYISQVMAGTTDHRISKLVDLALAIGQVPLVQYKSTRKIIWEDQEDLCRPSNQPSNTLKAIATLNLSDVGINWNDLTLVNTKTHYSTHVDTAQLSINN